MDSIMNSNSITVYDTWRRPEGTSESYKNQDEHADPTNSLSTKNIYETL